jgi:hypothetical protein
LQTLDEIGKTGLYVLEPHHQRLKRIADFIFMAHNLGMSFFDGKGLLLEKAKKNEGFREFRKPSVKHLMKLAKPESRFENFIASSASVEADCQFHLYGKQYRL